MKLSFQDRQFEFIIASDVEREGMACELYEIGLENTIFWLKYGIQIQMVL